MGDTIGVYARTAIWLSDFKKHSAAAASNTHVALKSNSYKLQTEGTLQSYFEAVIQLLKMYTTNEVIAETYVNMTSFIHP